jgi:hypothetical protein
MRESRSFRVDGWSSKLQRGIQTIFNHSDVNPDPESFRLDGSDPDQTFFRRKEVQFRQLFIVTSKFVHNLFLNIQFSVKKFNILPKKILYYLSAFASLRR